MRPNTIIIVPLALALMFPARSALTNSPTSATQPTEAAWTQAAAPTEIPEGEAGQDAPSVTVDASGLAGHLYSGPW